MKKHIKSSLIPLAFVSALLCAPLLKAADFDFHVDLSTSALTSAPNGPFFLDFQLNEGSGTLPNTVTLTNFQFTGGSSAGSPQLFGAASGDMSGTISLSDSSGSPYNEFFEGFTTGTTDIQFDVDITQNSPGATPDGFFVSILDSESGNPQIATDSPDGVSLITFSIGTSNTLSDVGAYASTSPAGVTAAVPEPASVAALLGGAVVLFAGVRRFGRRRAA